MAFEVSKGLFDFHAPFIGTHDECSGTALVRKRSGEQPGSAMQASIESIIGRVDFAFTGSARAALIGAHEVESIPIAVSRRETPQSDMANSGCGLAIERADVAPALSFRLEVFDGVTNAPDPIPAKSFDVSEPGTAKARIGDDNRMALSRHYLMESAEELAMGAGVVVAAYGMDFFVERDGASAGRHSSFEDEEFTAKFTIAPIDDDDRAPGAREEHRAECSVDSATFVVQMGITEQAVDGLDVMFDEGI